MKPRGKERAEIAPPGTRPIRDFSLGWAGPTLFMIALSLYFLGRYGGAWAETDSTTLTMAIRAVVNTGRLLPSTGQIYPNGYAYQVVSAFVVSVTGLDVSTLQQLVYPLTAAIVVIPAWMLYRELLGSARAATLTTMILLLNPEFLFVILRSSHEKFTRTLMLLALFWLVRSLRLGHRPGQFAINTALFYATTFALITSNNFLANSFFFAVTLALALGWLLQWRGIGYSIREMPVLRRVFYMLATCFVLVYLFTFYAYTPARQNVLVIRQLWQQLAALFLNLQQSHGQTYAQVDAAWINLPTYFMVSVADWLTLAVSFVIWLRQAYRLFARREKPPTQAAWLLWLLYAAFAVQGVMLVSTDLSGGAFGGNLELRIFPSFSMVAVAMIGTALTGSLNWRPRALNIVAIMAAVGAVAALSIIKATNEPLVSNKWTIYKPAEIEGLDWATNHLQSTQIWTGFDERLIAGYVEVHGNPPNADQFALGAAKTGVRYYYLTATAELRNSRLRHPWPVPPDASRVYDNGEGQLYHARPRTPYQQ